MAYPICLIYQLSGQSSKMRIPIAYRTEPGHIAYRLSPIAYRLSPMAHCLSPIAYRLSPIAYRPSSMVSIVIAYLSPIAYRRPSPIYIAYRLSPIA